MIEPGAMPVEFASVDLIVRMAVRGCDHFIRARGRARRMASR
ncbi:hypothetical protein [Burkholderia anthina]|nr:hypothetical protein [Burkholderia anthina]